MKVDIIITLALITIGLVIRPWRFKNSEKKSNTILEILGWISLLSGTLLLLSPLTEFKIGYYFGMLVGLIFIFTILNKIVNWLKKMFSKN